MNVQIGLVGKPNVGKSTFFAAATLVDVKIAPYPFTTIEPNVGIAYVRIPCVCREFNVKDNPRNSMCIEGNRFIPVELVDIAGLVPGAWQGRGLGNQFLDHVRRASVLIHVVDASGSTDEEGRPVKPGTRDPIEDVLFLEKELVMWMYQILKKDWDRIVRMVEYAKKDLRTVLLERLSGLGISERELMQALQELELDKKSPGSWNDEDLMRFAEILRELSKPMVIAANKIDIPEAEDNVKRMMRELKKYKIVPTSAEAELALRRAAQKGLIKYIPGDPDFEIIDKASLRPEQEKALEKIREIMRKWGGTGVIQALNTAVFDVLGMVAVFPVADEKKLTDTEGNVLPDVYLLPRDSTVLDLARKIHSEIAEKAVCAIDVRTGRKLSLDAKLQHRMVIRIVTRR
ncbi:MAG: redox-regulated ATPase YchF [Crenarchaeota archaeon]|nr:redox-regulated ATPase YchF [Thermoproteota archaeon]